MKLNNKPSFSANFLNTTSLKNVVDYAVQNNRFEKLNKARKRIEAQDLFTKIEINCGYDKEKHQSFFELVRYRPKYEIRSNEVIKTFSRKVTRRYYNEQNPLKLAYDKIIKMSNDAPNNKLYKEMIK